MPDTDCYLNCMTEVRYRISVVQSLDSGRIDMGNPVIQRECVFLQLRKILELIAFSSLCAHKEDYAAAYENFKLHNQPKNMLRDLAKVNPEFYPTPYKPVDVRPDGRNILRNEDGFLTQDEFIILYKACNEILHVRNPFVDPSIPIDIVYPVAQWVSRIQRLVAFHGVKLVGDTTRMIVVIPPDGPVRIAFGTKMPMPAPEVPGD